MPCVKDKLCKQCGFLKPLNQFNKNGKNLYRSQCKNCTSENSRIYRRSRNGFIKNLFNNQTRRSLRIGFGLPKYNLKELFGWITSQPNFEELYNDWVESNFDKNLTPSVDRIDDYKGYSLDNIRLVTWQTNHKKSTNDRRFGINNKNSIAVVGIHKITGEIIEFPSIAIASRSLNLKSYTGIAKCCKGQRKTSGGYFWSYKEGEV